MQVQLICYKFIFVNLGLRQTYKRLDKTFIKKKKKIKPINLTQPEVERFKFYWVGGNCRFY